MKKHSLNEGERVFLYSPSKLNDDLADMPTGWESKVLNWPISSMWMQGRVSWEVYKTQPSVLFLPSQGPVRYKGNTKIVSTIHDIGFITYKSFYRSSDIKRLKSATKRAIKKSDELISVSNFTKQELVDLLKINPEHITTTHLAAEDSVYKSIPINESASVLNKYRLGQHFFLSVGRIENKKNLKTIIRAFELFKQKRGKGDPVELVLIGDKGFGFDEINVYIKRSMFKNQIRLLGFVDGDDLPHIMSVATAYLFPSWYEGFGIPNLEAMASGTALITSKIQVHKEVCGDAALYVAPEKPEAWSNAMSSVVEDSGLRKMLIKKGLEHVKNYTWDKTALKTWEVLRSLV
jgi:glycosyltransferase involved in cell wall biosynthesis